MRFGGGFIENSVQWALNPSRRPSPAALVDSLMGKSGFGGCQENVTCLTVLCQL